MEHSSWKIQVGIQYSSWKIQVGIQYSSWKIQVEKFKLENSSWKIQVGKCKLENSSWKIQVLPSCKKVTKLENPSISVINSTRFCQLMIFLIFFGGGGRLPPSPPPMASALSPEDYTNPHYTFYLSWTLHTEQISICSSSSSFILKTSLSSTLS